MIVVGLLNAINCARRPYIQSIRPVSIRRTNIVLSSAYACSCVPTGYSMCVFAGLALARCAPIGAEPWVSVTYE